MKKITKKIFASVLAATMVMATGVITSAETVATPSISEAKLTEEGKISVTVNATGKLETFDFGLVYDEKVVKLSTYVDPDLGEEVNDITLSAKATKVFQGRVITCEPMAGYNYLVMGGANEKAPEFNNEALYTIVFDVIDKDAKEATFKVVKDSKINKENINEVEASDTKVVTLKEESTPTPAPTTPAPATTAPATTTAPADKTDAPATTTAPADKTDAPATTTAPAGKTDAPAKTDAPTTAVVNKYLNKTVAELDALLADGTITADEYIEVLKAKVENGSVKADDANKAIDAQVKAGKIDATTAAKAKEDIKKIVVKTTAPKATATSTATSGKKSPDTGDAGVVLPVIALCGAAAAVVVASRKKVEE